MFNDSKEPKDSKTCKIKVSRSKVSEDVQESNDPKLSKDAMVPKILKTLRYQKNRNFFVASLLPNAT